MWEGMWKGEDSNRELFHDLLLACFTTSTERGVNIVLCFFKMNWLVLYAGDFYHSLWFMILTILFTRDARTPRRGGILPFSGPTSLVPAK